MSTALNSTLRKIFVRGFYQAHAGMLISIFVMLISYCFFINTLGTVQPEQIDFWQFFFTVNLVSNPLIMICYLLICLLYAYKSWQFFTTQFTLPNHQFLYYSINSYTKNVQLKSWFWVQVQVFIPILTYTIYAAIVGFIFHYYLITIFILLFLFLLVLVCAVIYVHKINKLYDVGQKSLIIMFLKRIRKPLFLLYTFKIFNTAKLSYILTKILSWILIWSVISIFVDLQEDLRLLQLISSFIAISHAFILYQERDFNDRYLSFVKNLPYSQLKLFFSFSLNYIIILLPELLWLATRFEFAKSLMLILFIMSAILFMRGLLYLSIQIKGFLVIVFCLIVVFYITILFGYGWILIPINLGLSYIIFRKNYLRF